MFCKNCGAEVNEEAFACMSCGKEINPGAAICTNCGAAVAASADGQQKSKLVAVLLAFFLGAIGVHDFYLGYNKNGIIKIVLTVCTGIGGEIWALIDFIRLLTGSINQDANGKPLTDEF